MAKNSSELSLEIVLRQEIMAFIEKCFYELNSAKVFLPNWHLEAMAKVLLDLQNGVSDSKAVFNLPPRHFKSELISVIFPAWLFGHDPSLKIMSVSYSDILIRKHMRQMRQIMESSWYKKTFPQTKISPGKNTETLIELIGGGQRYAQSTGGQITGHGGDYIIVDDPHKVGPGLTADAIDKDILWFRETLISRLEQASKARVIIVMQRSRPNDLTGYIAQHLNYKIIKFEAIATKDSEIELLDGKTYSRKKGEVLHEAYTNKEDFDVHKDTMGPRIFEAQYQQNPLPGGGALVLPEYFGRTKQFLKHHNYDSIIQTWDTAHSTDPTAAYSVGLTFGERDSLFYLLNIFRKRLEYKDLVRAAHRLIDEFGPSHVVIEHASTGVPLYSELREAYGVGIFSWKPTLSKIERVELGLNFLSKKRIVLVEGIAGLEAFEQEVYNFTGGENEFADQVDALTLLLVTLREFHGKLPGAQIIHSEPRSLRGFM